MNKDIDYEINNIAYDEYLTEEEGGGIKCKNYDLCKDIIPHNWENKADYLCINCCVFGWNELEFRKRNKKKKMWCMFRKK